MPRPPGKVDYPTRSQIQADIAAFSGSGEPPGGGTITPQGVSITAEAMVDTIVDVIGSQTFNGTPTVTLLTPPAGVVASKVSPNEIEFRVPYSASGTVVQIPYQVTDLDGTGNANISVTVPNVALTKPFLALAQTEDAFEIDQSIANGWDFGMHAYLWDITGDLTWLNKVAGVGRKAIVPFVAWQQDAGTSSADHVMAPVGSPQGVGWTTKGQAAYDLLANNPGIHNTIEVITLEFESTTANTNDPSPFTNQQWVRDTADFFLFEMDAIGLKAKTYLYRITHLANVTPNKLTPRWTRLYYPFQNTDATDISIDYDDGVSPLRDLSGNGGLASMLQIGAYANGPRRHRITPRTAWPDPGNSTRYTQPGYGHYLAWLYSLERAGCDWICMYNSRFDSPIRYPYGDPTWPAMLRAIDDFLVDGISINSDLTDSTVSLGEF